MKYYIILLLNLLFFANLYCQNNYYTYNIKEKYDNIYVGAYNFPPSLESFIVDTITDGNLSEHGTTMESLLIMFETTKDKAYLFKFIKYAKEIQNMRRYNSYFFTSVDKIQFNARIIWPMAHFIYLINIKYPTLKNISLNSNTNLNLNDNNYSTFGEFADWLTIRVKQTLDKGIDDLWIDDIYGFANSPSGKKIKPILYSSNLITISGLYEEMNVASFNFQVPWGLSLIYMYLSTNQQNYGIKAIHMARMMLLYDINLYNDDNCQNYPSKCFSIPVLKIINNNSYSWGHNGWSGGSTHHRTCGNFIGNCSNIFFKENIAYASWDIMFPLLYNKFSDYFNPHLTSGQYFDDYQLVRFRNTFTKNLFAGYDIYGNTNFNNGVDGTNDNIPATTNGITNTQTLILNTYKSRCISWMPLYRFDNIAAETPNVYNIIMDYYNTDIANIQINQVNHILTPLQLKGMADVVSAQWDIECFNLTLKNRDVVYNQDFSAKNELIIDPSLPNTVYTNNNNSFADPVITEDKFIIEPNVEVNIVAGKIIHLKPGFHAKYGCRFRASIDNNLNNNCSSKSFKKYNVSNSKERISKSNLNLNKNINIYPNPNTGKFTIEINNNQKSKVSYNVYNIFGNIIKTDIIIGNNTVVDISNQPKGVYFVRLSFADGKVVSKKVVLQ